MDYKELLEAYEDKLGQDEDLVDMHRQLKEGREITNRKNFEGHITSSAIVLNTSMEKVLLIYHNTLQRYQQPGWHIDDDIHPWLNALKELQEETSLAEAELHSFHRENNFVPIAIHKHTIPENPKREEAKHYHYDAWYVFVADENQPLISEEEKIGDSKRVLLEDLEGEMKERLGLVMSRLT